MEYGRSNMKLHLKINVSSSKTVKVEIILANSKRNTGAKNMHHSGTASERKSNSNSPPVSFITHTAHYIHHKCLTPVSILSRTALHATDQVLQRDLSNHAVSPQNNIFSLEQPCDNNNNNNNNIYSTEENTFGVIFVVENFLNIPGKGVSRGLQSCSPW